MDLNGIQSTINITASAIAVVIALVGVAYGALNREQLKSTREFVGDLKDRVVFLEGERERYRQENAIKDEHIVELKLESSKKDAKIETLESVLGAEKILEGMEARNVERHTAQISALHEIRDNLSAVLRVGFNKSIVTSERVDDEASS